MYAVEIVEGKDVPTQQPAKEFEEKGKTVGLCLRLTKSIHGTGSLVVMDSGFCVVKAITELKRVSVFSSAMIKKRRYWPRYIKGDEIKEYFQDKEVGYFNAIKASIEGTEFHVYGMKEPDYVLFFMTTYGTGNWVGVDQIRKIANRQVMFKYPKVCHNHYKYCDSVNNHNARRMYPIALEEQWKTSRWPNWVFQFLLAVTEVNCNLVNHHIFEEEPMEQIEFRFSLAEEMIDNPYVGQASPWRKKRAQDDAINHQLVSLPPYCTFNSLAICQCKTQYNQLQCSCNLKLRVSTYCSCSPGVIMCNKCYCIHLIDIIN